MKRWIGLFLGIGLCCQSVMGMDLIGEASAWDTEEVSSSFQEAQEPSFCGEGEAFSEGTQAEDFVWAEGSAKEEIVFSSSSDSLGWVSSGEGEDGLVRKADVTNAFQDPIFAQKVREAAGLSAEEAITAKACGKIKELDLNGLGITSLAGIEYLTGLVRLTCDDNALTELDLTANEKLETLSCCRNQLRDLKLANWGELKELFCSYNQLKTFYPPYFSELEVLKCDHNKLKGLDLSYLGNLREVDISHNHVFSQDYLLLHEFHYSDLVVVFSPQDLDESKEACSLRLSLSEDMQGYVLGLEDYFYNNFRNEILVDAVYRDGSVERLTCDDFLMNYNTEEWVPSKGYCPVYITFQNVTESILVPVRSFGEQFQDAEELKMGEKLKLSYDYEDYDPEEEEEYDAIASMASVCSRAYFIVPESGLYYFYFGYYFNEDQSGKILDEEGHVIVSEYETDYLVVSLEKGKKVFVVLSADETGHFGLTVNLLKEEKLARPKKVRAKCKKNGILLSWKKVKHAQSYVIYAAEGNGDFYEVDWTEKTSYFNQWVEEGVRYRYRVQAVSDIQDNTRYENSAFSKTVEAFWMGNCKKLKALNKSGQRVKLTWKALSFADGYEVRFAKTEDFEGGKKWRTHFDHLSRKLSPGKWYFSVRPYAEENYTLYYGPWTKAVSVEIE